MIYLNSWFKHTNTVVSGNNHTCSQIIKQQGFDNKIESVLCKDLVNSNLTKES